jgi:hypothetical protein
MTCASIQDAERALMPGESATGMIVQAESALTIT